MFKEKTDLEEKIIRLEMKQNKLLDFVAQNTYLLSKAQNLIPPTDSVGAIITPAGWIAEFKKNFEAEFEG